MSWVRIDDQMPDHPKLACLGDLAPLALALQVRALCYAARYLTDGRIPEGVLPQLLQGFGRLKPAGVAWPDIMCRAGLWERDGDSYVIHDFLAYNPSRVEVAAKRERQRVTSQRGGQMRTRGAQRGGDGRFTPAKTPADSQPDGWTPAGTASPGKTSPPAPAPTPTTTTTTDASRPTRSTPDGYPEAFERTWAIYPRRAGGNPKQRAFHAWAARLKSGATADEVHAGVERYTRFCEATGKIGTEFVQQAATFFGPDAHFRERWDAPASADDRPFDPYAGFTDVTEELSQ